MKKIFLFTFTIFFLVTGISYSQHILFQSDFENLNFANQDSLPAGWKKLDADSNFFGIGKSWAVRDTNQIMGGDTTVNRPRAFSGKKSLHISWFAGKGGSYIGDDWVWTDSLNILNNDSLIFRSLMGNTEGISVYIDSLQIWICSSQNPESAYDHFTTIVSNLDTTYNEWKENAFSLDQYAGQRIYIAFRYYLNVKNGLWCNIDDILIGNRTPVGISSVSEILPVSFRLYQNFPNPFNPVTSINFDIAKSTQVKLSVYDINGRLVRELLNSILNAGSYSYSLNAADLHSGVYFYRIETNGFTDAKKFMLIK